MIQHKCIQNILAGRNYSSQIPAVIGCDGLQSRTQRKTLVNKDKEVSSCLLFPGSLYKIPHQYPIIMSVSAYNIFDILL